MLPFIIILLMLLFSLYLFVSGLRGLIKSFKGLMNDDDKGLVQIETDKQGNTTINIYKDAVYIVEKGATVINKSERTIVNKPKE